jgi:TRAP-type C4-dicarboxylate transport system substrate-binding protein
MRAHPGSTVVVVVVVAIALLSSAVAPFAQSRDAMRLATYFPGGTLSGRWMEAFAARVGQLSERALHVEVSGTFSSSEAFARVTQGATEFAGFYAPDLAAELPLLGLSAVPMLVGSLEDAWALYQAARPYYDKSLASKNQTLIASMPWRPGALWSRHALRAADDVASRAFYVLERRPAVSTAPLERLGATKGWLATSDIAVATGYTGNLTALAPVYKHFVEITYVVQLNFITVHARTLERLSDKQREWIFAAGRELEQKEWAATKALLARDHEDMRARGVAVEASAPAALRDALRAAADEAIASWVQSAGADAGRIVASHRQR